MRIRFLVIFALVAQMVIMPTQFSSIAAEREDVPRWMQKVDYLALGDSLAAGMDFNGEMGKSYTDFLAYELETVGVLQTFNKGFTTPGYTTVDVLGDIETNVLKEAVGTGVDGKKTWIRDEIVKADVITLSAGANDVLAHVQVDAFSGDVAFDQEGMALAFREVQKNYEEIMHQIAKLNGRVKVYVMGYYNPFPHMPDQLQAELDKLLQLLNGSIRKGIEGSGAVFVETADVISHDYNAYLPNPENIHLSEAGYEEVAKLFYETLVKHDAWMPVMGFTDVAGTHFESYIEQAVAKGLINGYADGSFKPDQPLTRAHAASLFVRALSLETGGPAPFKDIGHYKAAVQSEIAAAYHYGIIKGKDDIHFGPSEPVKRAHLALMISRTYEYATGSEYLVAEPAPYDDYGTFGEEVVQAISMLYELDMAKGSEGKFMPNRPATRGQAAKIFVDFLAVIGEE